MTLIKRNTLQNVFTFTRASVAHYIDSNGVLAQAAVDAPRIDHDPVTLAPRGLLVEPAATNLITESEDFGDAAWLGYFQKPALTTGHAAPDGTTNARSWNASATTGGGSGMQGGLVFNGATPAVTYTASVWLRASAPIDMSFGLDDGSVATISVTTTWQRFSYTGTTGGNSRLFQLSENVNDDIDIFVFGAQAEAGGLATSYIRTAGATATRAADNASRAAGSWVAPELTLLARFEVPPITDATQRRIAQIDDGKLSIRYANGTVGLYHRDAADAANNLLSSLAVAHGQTVTAAIAIGAGGAAGVINGGAVATEADALTTWTTTALHIGRSDVGDRLSGAIAKVLVYPQRLPDTQLQALTQ